jgi:hypothetical protein
MTGRLFRPLFGVLIALVLLGAPTVVQAVMPASCVCMHEVTAAPQPCSDHSSIPCKSIAAVCAGVMNCASVTGLPGHEMFVGAWLTLSPVAYVFPDAVAFGRSMKPLLGPPITI